MTSITGTKFFLKRSKGKKGAKMEDFFWDFWPTVDEEVRKGRKKQKARTRTINTKKKRAT